MATRLYCHVLTRAFIHAAMCTIPATLIVISVTVKQERPPAASLVFPLPWRSASSLSCPRVGEHVFLTPRSGPTVCPKLLGPQVARGTVSGTVSEQMCRSERLRNNAGIIIMVGIRGRLTLSTWQRKQLFSIEYTTAA